VTAPVFVVSSGRPAAVERMMPLLDGLEVRWCVPEGQGDTYRMAGELVGTGDIEVVEVPEPTREFDAMLAAQRNAVLAYAEASGWPRVVQINDDLRTSSRTDTGFTVARIQPPDEASEQVITAATAIEFICVEMDSRGAHFGGCAPTTNLFFQAAKRAVGTEHFIMAQLMVIDVGDGLRFPYEMGTATASWPAATVCWAGSRTSRSGAVAARTARSPTTPRWPASSCSGGPTTS
jgi:hypothetical protein